MTNEQKIATAVLAGLGLWLLLKKKPAAAAAATVGGGDVTDLRDAGAPAGTGVSSSGDCDCSDAAGTSAPCGCDETGAYPRDSGQPIGALGAEAASMIAGQGAN